MFVIAVARRETVDAETAHDEMLFARLPPSRRELADAADLPPYVVFSDRSLIEMATHYPQSPESFLTIHGVGGSRKLAAYGEPFLAAIRAHCAERGLPERPKTAASPAGREKVAAGSRAEEVGRLLAAGHSLAESRRSST